MSVDNIFQTKINNTIIDMQVLYDLYSNLEKKYEEKEKELKKLEKEYNELQEKYSILEASMKK